MLYTVITKNTYPASFVNLGFPCDRDTYDKYGEEGLKRSEQGGSADPFGDMFSHFGFGGGRRQRDEERRTANVEVGAAAERAAFRGASLFVVAVGLCCV